jgi:ABC-type transport system involved in Fe-S cluster assembly fused permease/ATPase subunit
MKSKSPQHGQTLKDLAPYLWPKGRRDLRLRVVASMCALIAAKGLNTYIPFLYKHAIDALSVRDAIILVPTFFIFTYAIARVGAQFFGEFRDLIFAKVTQHAQRTIGLKTFQHLHALSMGFHLERQTGGLSRVIERGTRGIQTVLSFMLFNIMPTIVEIILVIGILIYQFHYSFGLVTAVTISCYIAFTLSITNWRLKHRQTMNQKDSEANSKAIDSLLNFETVKYFANEAHEHQRFDDALAGYETAAVQSQTSLSILNIGQGVIISTGLCCVMLLASRGVAAGAMTIGDFVLLNTFLIQLYLPLNLLGFVYRETKQSLVDMEKMFELLSVRADVQDLPNAPELDIARGALEFRDVWFSYNPDRQILKGISFKVLAGKSVAIVGSSGAGKSTISRLLFRFYDVQQEQILIDGQDIRTVTQSSVRGAIGVVPQDTVLFNDTIGYNIFYGRIHSSNEEMVTAAKIAQIDQFVQKLPEKYETKVGERGLKLSGGEKQRVAIARTVLKAPKILLFDEATSALDTKTEKEIQESLKTVSKGRTTLVIAHRLSTVVDCDEILVLKEGEIIERGNHYALIAMNGEYAQMWTKQQEAQVLAEKLADSLAETSLDKLAEKPTE